MRVNLISALLSTVLSVGITLPESADAQVYKKAEDRNTNSSVPPQVGSSVTAPRPIYAPEPEFSETARASGYQGTCVLSLVVGADGKPRDISVVRKLGMHLDEKAIEAVSNWTFEPARKDGKPIAVKINVEVSFSLFRNVAAKVLSTEASEQVLEARSGMQSQIYRLSESQQPRICPRSSSSSDARSASTVTIAELHVEGDLRMPIADRDQIVASLKQQTYSVEADIASEVSERARAAWQNSGYFNVQVDTNVRVLTSGPDNERAAVTVRVEEGQQYRLEKIRFTNNRAIANSEALRNLFSLKDSDVFDRAAVAKGLENLRRAYGEYGYINLTAFPDVDFNDERQTISLNINVDEGKQFYVSRINLLGLEESIFQNVLKDLPIRPGDVYNQRLIELFLQHEADLLPTDGSIQPRFNLQLNEAASTVAVTYDFRRCFSR
jgi:TonB family protein